MTLAFPLVIIMSKGVKILVLVVSLIIGLSCNDNIPAEDPPSEDISNSTLVITFPDKSEMTVESAQYYPGSDKENDSYVIGFALGKDKQSNITWTLVFQMDKLAIGQEMVFKRVLFGIVNSSSSSNQTDKFNGQIFLDKVTDTGIIIRMKGVRFTIADGTYLFNGKLNCLLTSLN